MSVPVLVDTNGNPLRSQSSYHYGADTTAKEFYSWNPTLDTPDAELGFERDTLVARQRDLERNNGIARGAVQTHVDNVVGVNFRLSAKPDYAALGRDKEWADEFAKIVEAKWRNHADSTEIDAERQLNFHGMTSLLMQTSFSEGDGLALGLWRDDGRQYRTCFQVVDSDRLRNPRLQILDNFYQSGVQIDKIGAPIAYHIRKSHPASMFSSGYDDETARVPVRLKSGRQSVFHLYKKERPGQYRGKPRGVAVMGIFRMLEHYQKTELKTAIANSLISAFVKTQMSSEELATAFSGSAKEFNAARGNFDVQMQGGSTVRLAPGDDVVPFLPSRPASAYGEYVTSLLRHIAAGLNIPYEVLSKDFSKVNYSSARASLLEAHRYFSGMRKWLCDQWANPAYMNFLEELVLRGEIDAPDFYKNKYAYARCKWLGVVRGWIDPVKEAKAAEQRVAMNISTLEDEAAEQGRDWEEVLEQRAREIKKIEELGIPQTQAPTNGKIPDAPDNSSEEEDEETDKEDKANESVP